MSRWRFLVYGLYDYLFRFTCNHLLIRNISQNTAERLLAVINNEESREVTFPCSTLR